MSVLAHQRSKTDLVFLVEFIKNNQLKPVIDKVYPLKEAANAMKQLEAGQANGKIVVKMY